MFLSLGDRGSSWPPFTLTNTVWATSDLLQVLQLLDHVELASVLEMAPLLVFYEGFEKHNLILTFKSVREFQSLEKEIKMVCVLDTIP